MVIDAGLTVSDVDDTTLASATVSVKENFLSQEDVLAVTHENPAELGNITANYNSNTGVLTLTSANATATVEQWQAALRSVTYTNGSDTPTTGQKTIEFQVNDGETNSTTATKTVVVSNVITVPGAPTNVQAVAGDTQATVQFEAPASDGGASITEYTVTSSGGQTASGSVSPIIVTGLTNGTEYTFTVKAKSSKGEGDASNPSNSVTPFKNSAISSTTAEFDKEVSSQTDISITMTLNGNTLKSIQNGTTSLAKGTDYTVSDDTVTIWKQYLAKCEEGTIELKFQFTLGDPQTLSIVIRDSTIPTYHVSVNGGIGDGNYAEDTAVEIKADAAPKGHVFKNWTSNDDIVFADANSATPLLLCQHKP